MFGSERDDATGDCRRQYGEKRHDLCSSPNIISDQTKKYEMGGPFGMAGMWERSGAYRILSGNIRERKNVEDLRVDERIILKWILMEHDVQAWTGLFCLHFDITSYWVQQHH